ncbi:MAG: NAD(P)-binding protein [Candidatus Nezhaarchaeota archaeon]|nr:NAD(P)-binding protein [Candidatus Nezhaarchaeota archaeon]
MGASRRAPGMAYIMLSFTPWILYWTSTGLGYRLGVLLSLIASLAIIAPQAKSRDYYLMDVFSLIYFSTASALTFVLNVGFFVERSELAGYLALSLMAAASIAVGSPFTLRAAKKDWPEAYWREEAFLTINNVLSAAWTAVFVANALASLLLEAPQRAAFSGASIALGAALSALLPARASARLVAKRYVEPFKRFDWGPKASPGASKGEGEYDVIVVGAGIGGLACGSLLAKRGYRVLVLEQHHQVGGYCSSFQRRGFTFNTGVEDVSGLWEKGPVAFLLRELGLSREDLFVRNRARYLFKGRCLEAGSLEELVEELSGMFPGERGASPPSSRRLGRPTRNAIEKPTSTAHRSQLS